MVAAAELLAAEGALQVEDALALAAVADHVEGVGEGLAAVAAPRVLTPLGRRPLAFPPHRLRAQRRLPASGAGRHGINTAPRRSFRRNERRPRH